MMMIGTQKQPGYFSNALSFYHFFGDFVTTLVVSVAIFLSVEAPVLLIEKYFTKKDSEAEKVDQVNELENFKWKFYRK